MKKSRIVLFILSLLLWFVLSWSVDLQHIITGVACSLIVAFLTGDMFTENPHKFAHLSRYMWFAVYFPVFVWEIVKANIDVARRLLSPELPIKPGIVRVRTKLKSETGITFLANSLTLTPGTTTVDVDKDNGFLYIHWLNVKTQDETEATHLLVDKYEKILARIFE
ncbi:MAG: Na+/H+ antiporter subunit E [Elusimicrobiota bacterium]